MEKSLKFKHIETNLINLLYILIFNKNIIKYVYYLDNNPLSHADIDINLLETDSVILSFYDPKILTESKVKLFLNPLSGDLRGKAIGEIVYLLDIVIPNEFTILNGLGQFRAYRIADEFISEVDGKYVAGLGQVNVTGFNSFKVGDNFTGLSLKIVTKTSTLKGDA